MAAVRFCLPVWAVLCLLLLAGGCTEKDAGAVPKKRNRPPVPVKVGKVVKKDMPLRVSAVGEVEAISSVLIKARVSGPVTVVHFKEGREVREGELLFTIDEEPYRLSLAEARARLARDQALLLKAQADLRRNSGLVSKAIISRQDYEALLASAKSLQATVRADQAAVEILAQQLGYCRIKSPITGVTGGLQIDKGNLVKANDDNKYLVKINQIKPIFVTFTIPESHLTRIRRAMDRRDLKAEVRIGEGDAAERLVGPVTFVDNQVDVQTGTIRLKATFPNSDRRLWPGQFVNVMLDLDVTRDAVVTPSEAVQVGQTGRYVYVVKPDWTVDLRPVVTAREVGSETIIAKSLAPGETVVTDGQLRLVPGARTILKANGGPAGGKGRNAATKEPVK